MTSDVHAIQAKAVDQAREIIATHAAPLAALIQEKPADDFSQFVEHVVAAHKATGIAEFRTAYLFLDRLSECPVRHLSYNLRFVECALADGLKLAGPLPELTATTRSALTTN